MCCGGSGANYAFETFHLQGTGDKCAATTYAAASCCRGGTKSGGMRVAPAGTGIDSAQDDLIGGECQRPKAWRVDRSI